MMDYEIAMCDIAEVLRRHNKAQIGGYILPSDVAVERIRNIVTPKGKWIEEGQETGALGIKYTWVKCSECGWSNSLVIPKNYCPNCGAKMIKEDPENVSR